MPTDILIGQNVDVASQSVLYDATHMGLRRTGALGETFSRVGTAPFTAVAITSTQTLWSAIVIPAGVTVTNITFLTNTTAGATMTHSYVGLASSAKVLLAQSADRVAGAIPASSELTVALTTPYVTTVSDVYYVGVSVSATTTPTFSGIVGGGAILAPTISFSDATAVSTTLPATLTVSATAAQLYAWIS